MSCSAFSPFEVFSGYGGAFSLSFPVFFSMFWFLFFVGFYGLWFFSDLGTYYSTRGFVKSVHCSVFGFIFDLSEQLLGGFEAMTYFPFVSYLFTYLLFFNLLGLFPFSYSLFSAFLYAFFLAWVVCTACLLVGVFKEGFHFLDRFFPTQLNLYIASFVCVVELISFIFRWLSLSLRLAANLIAGHVLLDLCFNLILAVGFVTSPFVLVLLLFECFVAFVQAYVFVLLTLIYLKEVVV